MIQPINPDVDNVKNLPEMEVSDDGETWGWECERCFMGHKEFGPLAEGDILICEGCAAEYRTV